MKITRLKLKKIANFFEKLPKILAKSAFLCFLALLLFSLILGGFLFYKYSILIDRETPEVVEVIKFNKKLYQEVLEIQQTKQQQFEEANLKEYPALFKID